MRFTLPRNNKDERGIVSIMVTIILMIVISLIVIAFARTSRREQRDSLDRQLSTNAFYAAESGVNAAYKELVLHPSLLKDYTSNCTGPNSFAQDASISLPATVGVASSNAAYTCIFVDPSVSTIEHLPTSEPFAFPIKKAGVGTFGNVDIYWDANAGDDPAAVGYNSCPDPGTNPADWPSTKSCGSGILRLELTDDSHLSQNRVFMIYPSKSGGGAITYNPSSPASPPGSVETHKATCDVSSTPKQCHIQLAGLSMAVYARVSGLYKNYQLTVQASGNQEFADAQVMVDATGKAADVQRRIQVRYNLSNFGGPQAVIQAGASACKRFSIDGSSVTDDSSWPPDNSGYCLGAKNPSTLP